MKNQATNKKLQSKLSRLCKNCDLKKDMGYCPFSNKYECTDCNLVVAEMVLENYSNLDLLNIPINAIIKGVQAHNYSGQLRQTKVVIV